MSDLIDRNSLLRSLEKFAPEKHDALVEMLIKKEPTVDAVPVKWLEDRRGEIANKLDEVAGVLDLEELAEAYCCQLNTINWLIDTWLEREEE